MKKCREVQIELSAYIDDALPTATRTMVAKHVQDCGVCRARLAELKELTAGVAALPRLQPAPDFLADVRRKITRDSKDQPVWQDYIFRPWWLKVPLEGVVVIAIVFFVMRAGRPLNERKPSHSTVMLAEERASTPVAVASGAKPHSVEKLAPNRLVGNAAPSLADAAASEIVVVHAKDFNDARNRVQQLASTMNGRIVPPPPGKTQISMLFVELPSENVEVFRSRLQEAKPLSGAPQSLPANGPNSVAQEVERPAEKAARITVQIQILPPTD